MSAQLLDFPIKVSAASGDGDGPGPTDGFQFAGYNCPPDADPRLIGERLVNEVPRFSHLKEGEALIMFVFRMAPKARNKRTILGQISLPKFQGSLGDLAAWLLAIACQGHMPDYMMILDNEFWQAATPTMREALVFHELCHTIHETDKEGELRFNDAGRPVFGLQGHDLEEFNDVVARYGAWLPDVVTFANALRSGEQSE
jgi:hypothetical protein